MKHRHLLSTESLTLEYNAIDDILLSKWKGHLSNEQIKEGYESIGVHLKKNFCHKLLDNHLEVRGLWVDLAEWVAKDWHPRAEALGLEYHAFVFSTSTFSHLSTEKALSLITTSIVAGFEEEGSAEKWLKSF
ncbi:hypothetical protein ACD591_02900 [Rufibacter glacialis]|uniref:STAS/SEC14 domain-containing protein n=1 Tax=Rufibacter glacialis TaxID=1259555 RepID=A0A5M8QI88_9BACT|nr:hypothetical protein [Rufibacter glacialis]KAA6435827.1 hypothetical protein FOE74_07805 [Rufibacter glacialis]GGK66934.1 hypothetical protein GCM10011405_13590 [Rufibacter glacialis]